MLGPSSPLVGSRARSSLLPAATVRSITLASMRASPCPPGARTDGFTLTIHAAGFSGTAATIWAAARRKKTTDRSAVGKQCDGTSGKLSVTANQAIRCAVSGNARHFYTGRTTAEQFEFCGAPSQPSQPVLGGVLAALPLAAARDGVSALQGRLGAAIGRPRPLNRSAIKPRALEDGAGQAPRLAS